MVNKKMITGFKVFLLFLVILFIASYINYRIIKIDNSQSKSFHDSLVDLVATDECFDMCHVTPFDWDEMYIIRPYTPQKEMHKIVGIKWTTAHSYFGYIVEKYFLGEYQLLDDVIHELVFVKDGKVVCDVCLFRNKADFTQNEGVITAKDAIFIVDKSNERNPIVKKKQ